MPAKLSAKTQRVTRLWWPWDGSNLPNPPDLFFLEKKEDPPLQLEDKKEECKDAAGHGKDNKDKRLDASTALALTSMGLQNNDESAERLRSETEARLKAKPGTFCPGFKRIRNG